RAGCIGYHGQGADPCDPTPTTTGMTSNMTNRALIIGASGVAGSNLADRLTETGWEVHGLSRGRTAMPDAVQPIIADLTSATSVHDALGALDVTHVFFTTWSRQANEAENIRVNGAMVSNVLDALSAGPSALQH